MFYLSRLATFKEDDVYILLLWLLYCIIIIISLELGGVMTSLPATCPLQEELQQPPRQQLRSQVFSIQQTTFNRTFLIEKGRKFVYPMHRSGHNEIPRYLLPMIKTHTTLSCTRKNCYLSCRDVHHEPTRGSYSRGPFNSYRKTTNTPEEEFTVVRL